MYKKVVSLVETKRDKIRNRIYLNPYHVIKLSSTLDTK